MKIRFLLSAAVAVVLAVPAFAADIKSGPQTGEKVPGPFHPLNVTGPAAGEKSCLFCSNGDNPVAMIFARTNDEMTTKLIQKIDEVTKANKAKKMGSFVVYLDSAEGLDKKLKEVASKAKVETCVLSIDNEAGPAKYNVAKDADITVVLYTGRVVKANHAFAKGKLTDKDIEAIAADVKKILD